MRSLGRPVRVTFGAALLGLGTASSAGSAEPFTYNPPGVLVAGSGEGREDETVFAPDMRFPIEAAPAYPNSQVWGRGGSEGPGGGQCDSENYSYPWWDNYCETRSWDMPLCPAGVGHQGQDIRPGTCADDEHWAVAAASGTITSIGSYSVYLTGDDGTGYRYLHMSDASLQVEVGDRVTRGQRLGRVSNNFGGSATTIHLHFDLQQNVDGLGFVFVPPYTSLVASYEALIGEAGESGCDEPLPEGGGVVDDEGPCFILHGPAATWRSVTGTGYGDGLHWTYTWENEASNWAEWRFSVATQARYQVEAFITDEYAGALQARYTLTGGALDADLLVDQSGPSGWVSLGVWDLDPEVGYALAVYDGPGEALELQRQVVADAMRVRVADEVAGDSLVDSGTSDEVASSDTAETWDATLDGTVGSDVGAVEVVEGDRGAANDDRRGVADEEEDSHTEPRVPSRDRDEAEGDSDVSGCTSVSSGTPPWPTSLVLMLLVAAASRTGRRFTFPVDAPPRSQG